MSEFKVNFTDSRIAFDNAIKAGGLSLDPNSEFYAGKWMYMHDEKPDVYAFKNIITRKYILIDVSVLDRGQ